MHEELIRAVLDLPAKATLPMDDADGYALLQTGQDQGVVGIACRLVMRFTDPASALFKIALKAVVAAQA